MDLNVRSTQSINQPMLNRGYLKIYHQNVRSLRRKTSELLSHLHPGLPHVLCLTEHHLNIMEINYVNIENYALGAKFCRALYKKGGVAIYVHNSLKFKNIDLSKYCKEKDFEICAVKLNSSSAIVCIITIYRAPTGNFNYFLQSIDNVLQSLYIPNSHIIIFGDININYLVENEQRKQTDNLLQMYNLIGIVDFPMRLTQRSTTAIDSIFLDTSRLEDYSVIPLSNGLSDHNAQILLITILFQTKSNSVKIVRRIDQHSIGDFLYNLSSESWDSVFNTNDVNLIFNSFLNTYFRFFYSSFPSIRIKCRQNSNSWITLGIKTSCKRKENCFY